MEATHVGDWAGFAPSGKRLTVRGMSLFRLADGKIVEDNLNYNNSPELLFKELAATFPRS
jgi:hypothetical protein